jgi:hypothetical protein
VLLAYAGPGSTGTDHAAFADLLDMLCAPFGDLARD